MRTHAEPGLKRLPMIPPMKRLAPCLTVAVAFLALASSAAAASRPTLSVLGLTNGLIAGKTLPYIETGGLAELGIGYGGHLAAGAKLVLLEKDPGAVGFKKDKTPVRLSGSRAKVKVTFTHLGGPVSYEVAVLSGARQLSVSKAVTIYWTELPGGVFVELQGDYAAYTSRTVASENCSAPTAASTLCKGDASSNETNRISAFAGTYPVPPGWSVALFYNGQQQCTSSEIDARCETEITFPSVTAATVIPLTAKLTSPHGEVIIATKLVTVFP